MTKVRKGPKCASIGLAHDAFVGVKHSSTLARCAQARIAGVLFADRLSMIYGQLVPARPGVPVRIAGLFPGPGPLEGDAAGVQDLPQPLPPDGHRRGTVS